jgi:hypothetical protein
MAKRPAAQSPRSQSPQAIAFSKARALADASAVGNLEQSPLDNDHDEYHQHQEHIRRELARLLQEHGAGGLFDAEELEARIADPQLRAELSGDLYGLLTHYAEAGYFYGLAIGLRLGSGWR